jgi:hypothetical protein
MYLKQINDYLNYKKLKRHNWNDTKFIYFDEDMWKDNHGMLFNLTEYDLSANDWYEIVEDRWINIYKNLVGQYSCSPIPFSSQSDAEAERFGDRIKVNCLKVR